MREPIAPTPPPEGADEIDADRYLRPWDEVFDIDSGTPLLSLVQGLKYGLGRIEGEGLSEWEESYNPDGFPAGMDAGYVRDGVLVLDALVAFVIVRDEMQADGTAINMRGERSLWFRPVDLQEHFRGRGLLLDGDGEDEVMPWGTPAQWRLSLDQTVARYERDRDDHTRLNTEVMEITEAEMGDVEFAPVVGVVEKSSANGPWYTPLTAWGPLTELEREVYGRARWPMLER